MFTTSGSISNVNERDNNFEKTGDHELRGHLFSDGAFLYLGARMVDADLHGAGDLAELKRSTLVRVVGALVSLAMSRRVVTPLLLGSDPETSRLAALDAAGFSSAIPALFQ